jgi:hypothetical protein
MLLHFYLNWKAQIARAGLVTIAAYIEPPALRQISLLGGEHDRLISGTAGYLQNVSALHQFLYQDAI